jgi:hypothetical protein
MAIDTKATLHSVIDALSDVQAEQLLTAIRDRDPVALSLALAPADDEPITPEEEAAVEEARQAVRRGETLTTAELRRRLGL